VKPEPRRFTRLAPIGLAIALLLSVLGFQAVTSTAANASTNQFHGVNWANPNDNFITGDLVPVGLTDGDSYSATFAKATSIIKGFQALGANTVRMPFNHATVTDSWWGSYQGAIDAALALGMKVVLAPWLQNGVEGSTFYSDWNVVIGKYLSNSNVYFDIMNEPAGYTAATEDNMAAQWVATYPQIPRGRIMVPGAFADQNLCTVGADSRLSGTLLSIHIYGMFGDSHTTEGAWVSDFLNELCGYEGRAVLTEFGVPMNTGTNYDGARDGTNLISYLYGITDTVRSQGMGSILWTGVKSATQTQGPGPCENASCAITSLQGTAPNYTLSINNQSGLDRLQYAWGGSNPGGSASTTAINGLGSGRCLDVTNASQTAGTKVEIWDCNGGSNQTWTRTSGRQLTVYGGAMCLDATGGGTTAGTPVEISNCNGGSSQQWNINSNGTITGVQSGLCLDVTGASTANGALVELWTCNGGSNQQWIIG